MNVKGFIGRLKAAGKELATKFRLKQSAPPTHAFPILAKPESIPADPAEHAIRFAEEWYDRFEAYSRKRMREPSIDEQRIGAYDVDFNFRYAAFFPRERTGGENSPGARINLNSGVLNSRLLAGRFSPAQAEVWEKGRLRDRIDAVIVHEDIEGLKVAEGQSFGAAHVAALAQAPNTTRPISEGARRILRAMSQPKVS
jgi:hypothetical protein